MLTMWIWWLAFLLEAALLIRGVQEQLVRKFPVFYSYLLFVITAELLRFTVFRWYHSNYFYVYWVTQFFTLVIGSAIILEIYRMSLRPFPGTAKIARYLLLIVYGAVFAKTLANPTASSQWWLQQMAEELERNLRIVQSLAIFALILLFLWYAIPFGKNLRGILVGYSLFIGLSILQLTLMPILWDHIKLFWASVQPVSYLLVLGLWTGALWSTDPVSELKPSPQLENDYEALAASTRTQFQRALARLGWAVRL